MTNGHCEWAGTSARLLSLLLLLPLLPTGSAGDIAAVATQTLDADGARALFYPADPDAFCRPLPPRLVFVEPPLRSTIRSTKKKPFLVRRWWSRLRAAQKEVFPQTMLQSIAYDIIAPFIPGQLRVFDDNLDTLQRPFLFIVKHGGAVAEPIDLVSLDASIKVGHFLAKRLRAYHEANIIASHTLCLDPPIDTGISYAKHDDAIKSDKIAWYDDRQKEEDVPNKVLTLLNEIDMFGAPDVFAVGLFFNAKKSNIHRQAFVKAQQIWEASHSSSNDDIGDGEGPRVKFVGVLHPEASSSVLRNLTYDADAASHDNYQPQIVAIRPLDNLNMWMHSADTTSAHAIAGHVQSVLQMVPSESAELLRYGRFTSEKVWGMDTNTRVFVILDESLANKKNTVNFAEQQANAARAIARRIPASRAAFVLVPRSPENSGIIRYLGFSETSTATLAGKDEDAELSFVVANVAIMDHSGSVPKKFRMHVDFNAASTTQSSKRKTNSKDEKKRDQKISAPSVFDSAGVKTFLGAFFQGNLKPYWRSVNGPTEGRDFVDLRNELSHHIVERVAGMTLTALLKEEIRLRSGVSFLVGLTAQTWCKACEHNIPRLREAAVELMKTWPVKLRIITVDVDENEIAHLLKGVELRRQPWQYTLPLVYLPTLRNDSDEGMQAKAAPWRGAHGALPIDVERLTAFVRDAML